MTKRTVDIITAIFAGTGAILSIGATITAIPGLPGWFVNAWAVILALALVFNVVCKAIIGKEKNLPLWIIGVGILFLSVGGCASMPIKGQIIYSDPEGNSISIGSDGKAIIITGGYRSRDGKSIVQPQIR